MVSVASGRLASSLQCPQGAVATAQGLGAFLSNAVAGYLAGRAR